jgi:hypothetical protein
VCIHVPALNGHRITALSSRAIVPHLIPFSLAPLLASLSSSFLPAVQIRAVEGTAPLTLAVDATDALITEVNSVEAQFDAQIERIRQEQDQQHYQGYHQ